MADYRIMADDPLRQEIAALLDLHLAEMHQWSPACKVHAMPLERLRQPDVTFFSAWDGETLAAVGALKHLGDARGELRHVGFGGRAEQRGHSARDMHTDHSSST